MNELYIRDKTRQAFHYLRLGWSVPDIAAHLQMEESQVRGFIREEMKTLSVEVQEQQEYFLALGISRTEYLMKKLMDAIETPPLDKDGFPIMDRRAFNDTIKTTLSVMKFQADLLKLTPGKEKKSGVTVNLAVQNNTFATSSDLYEEALANIQMDAAGHLWGELPPGATEDVIELPIAERLDKLEAVVSKVVPDGADDDSYA